MRKTLLREYGMAGLIGTLKRAKRLIVLIVGFTVLIIGVAMIALPGPAIVVIPVGLAILGTELAWARKLLDRLKSRIRKTGSDA